MNEDEKFFAQFHEPPRPEFAAAVYKRINQPMNVQKNSISIRRMAVSFAAACAILLGALLAYQPTRALAFNFFRQIGAFVITTDQPVVPQATSLPPDAAGKPLNAPSAAAASEMAGFTVLAPDKLPEGYEQQGGYSILANGSGEIVVTTYANGTKGAFILINQYRYGAGDSYVDNVAGGEAVQDVLVRGQAGVWITGRLMTSPTGSAHEAPWASNWLRWQENGIVYTVISDDLSLGEALQLAESLK